MAYWTSNGMVVRVNLCVKLYEIYGGHGNSSYFTRNIMWRLYDWYVVYVFRNYNKI